MKSILYTLLGAGAVALTVGCTESSVVGNALSDETVAIIVDSNFTITGKSVRTEAVQSRTLNQLVGALDAKGYGSIHSDFIGQFMPSLKIDTANITPAAIDSVNLFMQMTRGDFVGDSLVPMGMEIYRVTRDLPYPIYSDFDPTGYYDPQPISSTVYTASTMNDADSVKSMSTIYTYMPLPVSLGRELVAAYFANPTNYSTPEAFAKNVFKGLYIRSSYGAGRISHFNTTSIRVYYTKEVWNEDSLRYETKHYNGDYYAVTPEVVLNNDISYEVAPELETLAQTSPLVVAPVGYEVEMRFPAPEIISSYNKYSDKMRVLNSLTLTIPAEEISNDYEIAPPPNLLLILKNKKEEFFASNKLTDNKTSFYSPYNSTTRTYSFAALRSYMIDLLSKKDVTEDDYTFLLIPVEVNTEAQASGSYYYSYGTTYTESSIVPYVAKPVMAKILLDKAKIKLTFSTGNPNNL